MAPPDAALDSSPEVETVTSSMASSRSATSEAKPLVLLYRVSLTSVR